MSPARRLLFTCMAALSLLVGAPPARDHVNGQGPALEPVIVEIRAIAAPRAFDAVAPDGQTPAERNSWRGARDRSRLGDNERRATVPRARVVAAIRALGGQVTRHFHALPSLAARIPAAAIDTLRAHPDVVAVSPDLRRHPRLSTAVPSILSSAFTTAGFTGTSVDVAVVDTGIYALNTLLDPGPTSRLVNVISLASGCAPPDDETSADDFQGHGTAIAGVIALRDPDGPTGGLVEGVAPGVRKLINVKAACATDSGVTQQDSDVIGGIDQALGLAGGDSPEVINYSFGTIGLANAPEPDPYQNEMLARYLDAVVDGHGKVITVPAGSNGPSQGTIDTPGIAYNVITVGAIDTKGTAARDNDVVLSESGRGPTDVSNRKKPDVVAPGVAITSASYLGGLASTAGNPAMGTSLSSAFVAGLAALILDAGVGDLSVADADKGLATKALIINSAQDIDPFTTGWSTASGWGYVDGSTAYAQRGSVSAVTVSGSGTTATYFARAASSTSKATLAWTRDVTVSTSNPTPSPLKNLDLALYSASTGLALSTSASTVDNVEQVQSTAIVPAVLRVSGVGFGVGDTQRAVLAHSGGFVRSAIPSPSLTLTVPPTVGPLSQFTVTALVTNITPVAGLPVLPLAAPTVTLTLPAGYALAPSSAPAMRTLATLVAGDTTQLQWSVIAPASASGTLPIGVSVASTGYDLSINASASQNIVTSGSCTYVVQPTAIIVSNTAGTTNVTVTTACPWTPVSDSPAWLTVPSAQQTGTQTITLTHAANTSLGDRIGTVNISGQTVTVTQRSAPRSYYLAEGATGTFFDLDIAIANPNDVDAPVAMTFLDSGGNTYPLNFTLPAKRSRTVAVEREVPALATAEVSTIVTSPTGLPLVVERSLFWDASYYGGHTGSAVDGPNTTWYFGEGFQSSPVFDTFILLANASASPANVTLQFLRQGGTPVTTTKTIPPTSRANFWAAELPALEGQSFSTVVTSNIPIIAERAMYFGTPFFNGGHESAGVSTPATRWFHPEGRTGPFFDTYILIGNPGNTPAHVTARFLRANDTPITTTLTVGAQSRETIYVDGIPGLPDNDVSTEVTSDVPVISERAMYWPGEYAQWYEAHNSFGVTSTGLAWGLAEGRFGFPQNFETYILLTNPASTPTRVRVTFLRQGSKAPVVSVQDLAANSRANVDMSALLGAPDYDQAGERFGAIIESLDNVGIAVERALYFSTGGVFWSGGTNATAVKIR